MNQTTIYTAYYDFTAWSTGVLAARKFPQSGKIFLRKITAEKGEWGTTVDPNPGH